MPPFVDTFILSSLSLDDPHCLRGEAGADVQLLREQPAVRVRAGREDGRAVLLHRGQPPRRALHVLRQPADLRHRLLHGPSLPRKVDLPKHSNIDNIIYLDSVENFCDMTEDNLHDTELPTKQNLYCDQRSTWEVS